MDGLRAVDEGRWDDVEGGGSPLSKGETLVADGGYQEEYQEQYLEMLEGMETRDG